MSYDIYFYRPRAGVRLSDVVSAEYEDRGALVSPLSPEELVALAKSVAGAVEGYEVFEDDDCLIVAPGDEDADEQVEVMLMPEECSIGFPYGQDARRVFGVAQQAAEVLRRAGLHAHDPQLDGDFDVARARTAYTKTSRDVLGG
jgi:hypothetical protein